jgi:hypothetical protein
VQDTTQEKNAINITILSKPSKICYSPSHEQENQAHTQRIRQQRREKCRKENDGSPKTRASSKSSPGARAKEASEGPNKRPALTFPQNFIDSSGISGLFLDSHIPHN